MASVLVGLFKVELIDPVTFQVDFEIPDNCNYKATTSGGVNIIEVELNSGQSNPSFTYKWYKEQYKTSNEDLSLEFHQKHSTGTVKKPKIDVR